MHLGSDDRAGHPVLRLARARLLVELPRMTTTGAHGRVSMLTRVIPAASLATVLAFGCVPRYEPPTFDQPHATIKIRRSYDAPAGAELRERLLVDDHSALDAVVPAALAATARIDAAIVYPVPATFSLQSAFFHYETKRIYETYTEQVPTLERETYDCSSGYGMSRTYRTCTRMTNRYRVETRQRWATKTVEVGDGACVATSRFAPVPGAVYLLQYSFQQAGVCTLSCFEQVPGSDASFQNRRCLVPLPTK